MVHAGSSYLGVVGLGSGQIVGLLFIVCLCVRTNPWQSVSEAFWLPGLETNGFACSKYCVWNAVFYIVCGFGFGILSLDTLRTNRRNRHLDGPVPNGYEWSRTI